MNYKRRKCINTKYYDLPLCAPVVYCIRKDKIDSELELNLIIAFNFVFSK